MAITNRKNIDELMGSKEGRAVVMAAHYLNQAKLVSTCTGRTAEEVLSIVETLVVAGLLIEPSVAMDELVEMVRGTKRNIRFDLLRDKLVLQLYKIGKIDTEQVNALLGTIWGQGEEEHGNEDTP